MFLPELLSASPFATVYEGETDAEVAAAEAAAEAARVAEEAKTKTSQKVKFTPEQQAFVNSEIAKERRKAEAKAEQLVTQLETEKNRSGITEAEKQQLAERIETIKSEFATKEELNQRATSKKVQELETEKKRLEAEGSTWKTRYERDRKRIDLTQAAAEAKAYNPSQVVNELERNSRLVEVVGEDGKGVGEYETKVKIQTRDKDGKAVTLDLDPKGAVAQLREMPEYANLFISAAQGGLGGGNLGKGGAGGSKPAHEMSTAEYIAERKKARTGGGR